LFIDKGIPAIVIPFEIIRGGFAAKIAINALVINVVFSVDVFGIPVGDISHIVLEAMASAGALASPFPGPAARGNKTFHAPA
jgi:hypothetical protein